MILFYFIKTRWNNSQYQTSRKKGKKGKKIVVKIVFKKMKSKVKFTKNKTYYQHALRRDVGNGCFSLFFYTVVEINCTYSKLFTGFDKLVLNICWKILWCSMELARLKSVSFPLKKYFSKTSKLHKFFFCV